LIISRLGSKAGLVLTRTKVERRGGLVYRVAAEATDRQIQRQHGLGREFASGVGGAGKAASDLHAR